MKLAFVLTGLSFALSACDPGGTPFDEFFHPTGKCGQEVKLQNNSSQTITITASLYDRGPAYCDGSRESRETKTVAPGEFGSVRAELTCNRCYELEKSAFADGESVNGSELVTCSNSGCIQN